VTPGFLRKYRYTSRQSFTTVTASLNGGLDLECRFKFFKVRAAKDQAYAALSFADQDGIVEVMSRIALLRLDSVASWSPSGQYF
jgi:hypothetical protein